MDLKTLGTPRMSIFQILYLFSCENQPALFTPGVSASNQQTCNTCK